MWIARDKDGWLYLYEDKPVKTKNTWSYATVMTSLSKSMFPDVTWKDEEPTEVEIVKVKKPTFRELYDNNSLGETIIIDD